MTSLIINVYLFLLIRDNDRSSLNCASMLKGGWWWKSCGRGLNGLYLNDPQDLTARQGESLNINMYDLHFKALMKGSMLQIIDKDRNLYRLCPSLCMFTFIYLTSFFFFLGIVWFRWRGWDYTLKRASMMIRPKGPGTST